MDDLGGRARPSRVEGRAVDFPLPKPTIRDWLAANGPEATGVTGMDDLVTWLRAALNEREALLLHTQASGTPCPVPITTLLAEVDAKRRILDGRDEAARHARVDFDHILEGEAGAMDYCVKVLALPYADRPGYREEWRP